ncbi:diiron oxygenase [Amorphoplanes digitatis]|uniref:p-aminobenzoate N-oxygenase AurF n=1 Tax=Actinoplanes digitatis TaxID=1868 RepID=A0A7W7MP70_9ACTN|nr:diiron oxygenase [Actinoplanes digitatis]MBB4761843.1 hypothetical protein [Actinoplanes digitatis]BFE70516.1 hypothetical protein GCM10020092_038170 [Actinoplanes digitatis]GID90954.1 hypothetical protein Adi01nite_03660 [Actinoplanes digitatis]
MSDPMRGWYDDAAVRGQRRRILHEDRERGLVLFPEKEIPYLGHEAVVALAPAARDALVARHLYQYLLYTVHLETKVVNRGVAMVANDEADYAIAPQTRLDAFKIYCDEGYHAMFNLDVVQQIERATGVASLPYDFRPRLDRLDHTAHRFFPEHPRLGRLLQVAVFETVVTATLADLPRDPTVYRVVRDVVGDHARDEAHHHAFFVRFFRETWTHLTAGQRVAVARALPHLIDDCLRPDVATIRRSLIAAGLPAPVAADVVADCYAEPAVRAVIRRSARHTLALADSVGALDLPGVRDIVGELGLAR